MNSTQKTIKNEYPEELRTKAKTWSVRRRLLIVVTISVFIVCAVFFGWEYLHAYHTTGVAPGALIIMTLHFLVMALVLIVLVYIVTARLTLKPLKAFEDAARRVGGGDMTARVDTVSTPVELSILAREFNSMSEELAEVERLRSEEMEKARRIQRNLLPQPEAIADIPVAWKYEPATEVAGDYFDVKRSGDVTLCAVADVAGHGVPAALGAAMLKTLFTFASRASDDTAAIIAEMSEGFASVTLDEEFATMSVFAHDRKNGELRYASAGHEPAVIMRGNGEIEILGSTGPIMGVTLDEGWEEERVDVRAGDRLFIFTDGLTETQSPDGSLFGGERLIAALKATSGETLQNQINHIFKEADAFRGEQTKDDDITCLAYQF